MNPNYSEFKFPVIKANEWKKIFQNRKTGINPAVDLINKILKYGQEYDWFIWGITFWAFLFVLHIFNVFVTNKFMGTAWERAQREKLVQKQKHRIAKMEKEMNELPEMDMETKKKLL